MADATESKRMRSAAGIVVRAIEPADGDECARIVYEAFAGLHDRHRFPRDFPTLEAAAQLASAFIAHPAIWGVVAEVDAALLPRVEVHRPEYAFARKARFLGDALRREVVCVRPQLQPIAAELRERPARDELDGTAC